MPMYQYIKAIPRRRRMRAATISWLFMASGLFIILWTIWPIVSFLTLKQHLLGNTISPVSERSAAKASDRLLIPLAAGSAESGVLGDSLDYTNPNVWFPTKPQKKIVAPVNSYQLSIPKLGIANATVVIAGDDLKQNLIHYGGTALPGEYGNSVIFGHSTLPQFFSPKNYTSIFSTLPTLEEGDEIFVTYDHITYRYEVYDMVVVKPTDLSPLEQRFDDTYLTLVTCVPPGTYWQRLNVKAKLAQI